MDRTRRQRRGKGALWLLVLAVVSVLAPVWADTYVCPMAKQAQAKAKSCCAKAEVALHQAIPGQSQLEPPCDCPKLSWSANPADQVRELRTGAGPSAELAMDLPRPPVSVGSPATAIRVPRRTAVFRSSPPLWRVNQAILC